MTISNVIGFLGSQNWVPVELLYASLKKGEKIVRVDSKDITLFDPLFSIVLPKR